MDIRGGEARDMHAALARFRGYHLARITPES